MGSATCRVHCHFDPFFRGSRAVHRWLRDVTPAREKGLLGVVNMPLADEANICVITH